MGDRPANEGELGAALLALDELTRRLRRDCPWDREQDERSIVPHTIEEAYELAAAVHTDDDAHLLDELGDVLFQVYFLSLLMEERGAGSLAAVAEHCRQKLIRRHPHVFGAVDDPRREASTSEEVLDNWRQIKRDEREQTNEIFSELPENLPALLYARKLQQQAANSGFDVEDVPYESVETELGELKRASGRQAKFDEVGELLLAVVSIARKLRVDPELALHTATKRFREQIESTSLEEKRE